MGLLSFILSLFGRGTKNPLEVATDILTNNSSPVDKVELERVEQKPALEQIELNKIEARTQSSQRGWRSLFGYICVMAIGWTYLIQPIVVMIASLFGKNLVIPATNIYDLLAMLSGMLGIIPLRKNQ